MAEEDVCPRVSVSVGPTKMLVFSSILTEKWQRISREAELLTLALGTLNSGEATTPSFSDLDPLPAAGLLLMWGTAHLCGSEMLPPSFPGVTPCCK